MLSVRRLFLSAALACVSFPALAVVVDLRVTRDTTLWELSPSNNLGGSSLAIGVTGQPSAARGLIDFDVSSIPANAVVQAVTVTLFSTDGARTGAQPATWRLYRSLSSWGEGTGTGNTGRAALPGEATWLASAEGTDLWGAPGGQPGVDFASGPSATVSLGLDQLGLHTFLSTPTLVADVQGWVNGTAFNHGWFVIADGDIDANRSPSSARRAASIESLFDSRATLSVTYEVIPEPAAGAALVGLIGLLVAWRSRR